MAVTIINRPRGHKISTIPNQATVSNSSGDALFTSASVSGVDRYVYVDSNIESYSGFKRMSPVSGTTFKIYNQDGGDPVPYIQNETVTFYYSELDHGWQSVHLPIVYEIQSDIFPTNNPDLANNRTIGAFADDNGYTRVAFAGAGLTDYQALFFVELVGDGPLAGVYQIAEGFDTAHVNLDLAYDPSYDFSPYKVVRYYSNYWVAVNVYGNLQSHPWSGYKPLELLASLKLIPDQNNTVKFSISEIIKGAVKTNNNLMLDTLPNNIDFYSQFFIEIYEAYDTVVDGQIVLYTNGDVTTDDFIGHAVNSMMPFKSFNESFMSDYIFVEEQPARWLLTQDRPTAVIGYFFDMSFLLNVEEDVTVQIQKKLGGSVIQTDEQEIPYPGIGVIRIPIEIESGYDEYCVSVLAPVNNQPENNDFSGSFSPWTTNTNYGGGTIPFTYSSGPFITLTQGQTSLDVLQYFPLTAGGNYTFRITGSVTSLASGRRITLYARNSGTAYSVSDFNIKLSAGAFDFTFDLSPTQNTDQLFFVVGIPPGAPVSSDITIDEITLENQGLATIVESVCIDIVDECGSTFKNDNLRLTESEIFRELE